MDLIVFIQKIIYQKNKGWDILSLEEYDKVGTDSLCAEQTPKLNNSQVTKLKKYFQKTNIWFSYVWVPYGKVTY